MRPEIKEFMDALKARTVGEAEFHQAVEEVTVFSSIALLDRTKEVCVSTRQ